MSQLFTFIGSFLLAIIVFIAVSVFLAFIFTKLKIDNLFLFICIGVVSAIVILWYIL